MNIMNIKRVCKACNSTLLKSYNNYTTSIYNAATVIGSWKWHQANKKHASAFPTNMTTYAT